MLRPTRPPVATVYERAEAQALAIVESGDDHFQPDTYSLALERTGLSEVPMELPDATVAWEYLDFLTR